MYDSGELQEVYTTANPVEAEIIKGALQDEGIKCAIGDEGQAALPGVGIMEIKILVRPEDYDRARAFVEEHQRKG